MIGRGGGDRERCKQHYKHIFFVYCSLLGFFVLKTSLEKKCSCTDQASNETAAKNPGGTFLQIQTDK